MANIGKALTEESYHKLLNFGADTMEGHTRSVRSRMAAAKLYCKLVRLAYSDGRAPVADKLGTVATRTELLGRVRGITRPTAFNYFGYLVASGLASIGGDGEVTLLLPAGYAPEYTRVDFTAANSRLAAHAARKAEARAAKAPPIDPALMNMEGDGQ